MRALCHFAAAHLETPSVAVATRAVEVCPRGWEVPTPPFSRRPRGQAPPLRYAGVGVCRYHGKGALVGHILPRGGSALGIREGGRRGRQKEEPGAGVGVRTREETRSRLTPASGVGGGEFGICSPPRAWLSRDVLLLLLHARWGSNPSTSSFRRRDPRLPTRRSFVFFRGQVLRVKCPSPSPSSGAAAQTATLQLSPSTAPALPASALPGRACTANYSSAQQLITPESGKRPGVGTAGRSRGRGPGVVLGPRSLIGPLAQLLRSRQYAEDGSTKCSVLLCLSFSLLECTPNPRQKESGEDLCVDVRASEVEAGYSKSSKPSRPALFPATDRRVGLSWPGAPPRGPRSVLLVPEPLPAHPSFLWDSENGAPSGRKTPRFCPTRGGNPGACRAATVVGILPLPLPPAVLSLLSPTLRICRGWGRARVCRGPAAHIWPAAGTRPLRTAADPAPSVGAEQRLTSFCAWNARRRGPGSPSSSLGFWFHHLASLALGYNPPSTSLAYQTQLL